MVQAVVGNRLDQVSLGVLYVGLVDAQPFHKSILHNVFCIGLTPKQVVGDAVQQRLIENNGLRLIHGSNMYRQRKVSNVRWLTEIFVSPTLTGISPFRRERSVVRLRAAVEVPTRFLAYF